MIHERNFDRIQHEYLRKKIDAKFNRVHDKLEDAYYQYWKNGLSKRFVAKRDPVTREPRLVFDIRPNNPELMGKAVWNGTGWDTSGIPLSPKELFDKLHGLLWKVYTVKFHQYNLLEPSETQIPLEEYNAADETGTTPTEKAVEEIGLLVAQGIELDGEEEENEIEQ